MDNKIDNNFDDSYVELRKLIVEQFSPQEVEAIDKAYNRCCRFRL
ncbi:MAG: hypothetical protein WAN84_00195 [Acutalibacteraceae bacterium]